MLKASFQRENPLSKSTLFPLSFKPKDLPTSHYSQKNGSIVNLGTTGVENEEEVISLLEEELFLENSLESTKALMNYDCWDEDIEAEEWLKKCKEIPPPHAVSPIYMNKRYVWTGVEIVSFDKKLKKFMVKIMVNGNEKMVSRLSLMFKGEDHAKFMERVQLCKQRQQRAEDEIRFFKYVEAKNDDFVGFLDLEAKRNILAKTRKIKKNEEESQQVTRLIDGLMKQVEMEYKLFMKKVVVLREMQEEDGGEKFRALRIRMRFIKGEIPFYGTIGRFDFPKKEYMDIVKNL